MSDDEVLAKTNLTADTMAQIMVDTGQLVIGSLMIGDQKAVMKAAVDLYKAGQLWQKARLDHATLGEDL